jgi:HAD superfamily hydrolase (TIGR01509 family)
VTAAQARPAFRPQGVVFDCDGLLLETESRWTIAETALLERHGGRFTPAFKQRLLGTSRETSQLMIADELGLPVERAPGLGDELEHEFEVALRTHGTEPMPGVVELLAALHGVVPIAMASNNGERMVRIALEQAGVDHYFAAVVCASPTRAGKPAPDTYLEASAAIGVDPSLAVALEDSVVGATAARAAGCFTIGVPSVAGATLPAHATYRSLTEVGLAELGLQA